ncbi:hypothetical protein EDC01DRAFT_617037 [Geopyxis carbonaria]|nr:hypothetical protein EDC01DRAFT_617037 [Geopyxis carbonaria]
MYNSFKPLLFLLCFALAASAAPLANLVGGFPGWAGVKTMFVFGDSYSRIKYIPNQSPNPSANAVMGLTSPGFPSSNGPNYVAYLVRKYHQSEILTYDLAVGGATITRSLVEPPSVDYLTFEEQVDQYFKPYFTAGQIATWDASSTLFVIWVGINDVRLGYGLIFATESGTYSATTLIDKYFSQVKKLYDAGARNFVFMTVPDVTRAPQYTAMNDAVDSAKLLKYLEAYNTELLERVIYFREKYPATRCFRFDSRKVMDEVLDAPHSYGLTATDSFCEGYLAYHSNTDWESQFISSCGVSVKEYFWLDKVHPTSTVHNQWALRMSDMLINPT